MMKKKMGKPRNKKNKKSMGYKGGGKVKKYKSGGEVKGKRMKVQGTDSQRSGKDFTSFV